jgi:hypothetical protein
LLDLLLDDPAMKAMQPVVLLLYCPKLLQRSAVFHNSICIWTVYVHIYKQGQLTLLDWLKCKHLSTPSSRLRQACEHLWSEWFVGPVQRIEFYQQYKPGCHPPQLANCCGWLDDEWPLGTLEQLRRINLVVAAVEHAR